MSGEQFTFDEIEKFYKALRSWQSLVGAPENEYWVKMSPGRALIVDNYRVFHGRSGFTGKRRLCGAYLNWDDYRSAYNMLVNQGVLKKNL